MPRTVTITKTLYKFDELPTERAKEKARDWYRQIQDVHLVLLDLNIDDFRQIAAIFGIEFAQREVQSARTGKKWYEYQIYYTGFSCQGDGACFDGSYTYAADAPKKIREYAPQDSELQRIADDLEALQSRNAFQLIATCKQSGRYYHAYSMGVDVSRADDDSENEPAPISAEDEKELRELLRDFANWIYRTLEKDYEYQTSNEAIDESLTANEYEFTEDGKRDNGN